MTTLYLPSPLVSVRWLAAHIDHPDLVVLDASMQPVGAAREPTAPDDRKQIPRTRVFDFDRKICDHESPLPHMMPCAELFTREVRALGVHRSSVIVAYDRVGIFSSPRAWWMFKAMGHEQVAVLDGGLRAWKAAGLPRRAAPRTSRVAAGDFVARPRKQLFCDADQVMAALADPRAVVLDARSEGRFLGRDPEPRAGLRPGHMPNARNLPFNAVQVDGCMRSLAELASIFAAMIEDQEKLIFSCGSGVTACILALAAELAGRKGLAVYDGSWSEWGIPSSRPVAP